jgi:hypothetical protein
MLRSPRSWPFAEQETGNQPDPRTHDAVAREELQLQGLGAIIVGAVEEKHCGPRRCYRSVGVSRFKGRDPL